jgi:hypothetical protein
MIIDYYYYMIIRPGQYDPTLFIPNDCIITATSFDIEYSVPVTVHSNLRETLRFRYERHGNGVVVP